MYEGLLHKQQNEFDTWLNMQLRGVLVLLLLPVPVLPSEPAFRLLEVVARLKKRLLDLTFFNIHFPRLESQFVKPCRAGRKSRAFFITRFDAFQRPLMYLEKSQKS